MKAFGERLREKRKASGKTIAECANIFGVTQPAWTFWEQGTREPKLDTLVAIADFFETPPDELLGLPSRGGSAAVKVSNSPGAAVANGRNARASVGPSCEQCPFKMLAMEFKDRAAKLPRKR